MQKEKIETKDTANGLLGDFTDDFAELMDGLSNDGKKELSLLLSIMITEKLSTRIRTMAMEFFRKYNYPDKEVETFMLIAAMMWGVECNEADV